MWIPNFDILYQDGKTIKSRRHPLWNLDLQPCQVDVTPAWLGTWAVGACWCFHFPDHVGCFKHVLWEENMVVHATHPPKNCCVSLKIMLPPIPVNDHHFPPLSLCFPYYFPIIPHYFPIGSLLFPYYFHIISLLFPCYVPIMALSCPYYFTFIISLLFPYYVPLISLLFPYYFHIISRLFPSYFPIIPHYFPIISILFPYYFPMISLLFPFS